MHSTTDTHVIFKIDEAEIFYIEIVQILGIDIDYVLRFNVHISNIYKKAVQQLHV